MTDLLVHDPATTATHHPGPASRGSNPRPAKAAAPAVALPQLTALRTEIAETLAAVAPHAGALEFEVDQGHTIVRVVDRETKQLVRQIPSEEMVEIRRALERAQGILIRSKA